MSAKKPKAILISLGGTPAPLIYSLNHQKPDYICFFVSEESKSSIDRDILPRLDFKPKNHDWIVTPSAEILSECFRVISQELPRILKKWQVDLKDLIVDYTGGTKTMSVALALATIQFASTFTYVGGIDRTKDGLGIVINGKEKMWYVDNPWDEIAVIERKEAALLFNKARYSSAAAAFSRISEKVSENNRPFFQALKTFSEGYDFWDRFQHKEAKRKLFSIRDILSAYALGKADRSFEPTMGKFKKNLQFLGEIENNNNEKRRLLQCYDLIANAQRRAELEKKYDDAVARLYRVLEALAQHQLDSKYGIKTSNVHLNDLPDFLKEEYKRKYFDPGEGKMKLPLYASYQLLKELNDELGHNFFEKYERNIKLILDLRNKSILAHGFNSVKEETCQKMVNVLVNFMGIKEEDLPQFPVLSL